MRTVLVAIAVVASGFTTVRGAHFQRAESVDLQMLARIRAEAFQRSQVMAIAQHLTDVSGGRLTNSPGLREAQSYARDLLRGWGVANAHLEPWGPFGRGWSLDRITAGMTSISYSPLIAYAKAWSPRTNGPASGEPVLLDPATVAEVDAFRGRLGGRIVLFGPERAVPPAGGPQPRRLDEADLQRLIAAPAASASPAPFQPSAAQRAASELALAKWRLVYDERPAVVLEPGSGDAGTAVVTAAVVPTSPSAVPGEQPHPWDVSRPYVVPQVVIAAEQYNRIVRLVSRHERVTVSIDVSVRLDDAAMSANVIGDIPGGDRSGEVVMFGGCLDSWHTGTGATDNAAGAAAALEAMRILNTLGVTPRRTIRIGLWSAEEQGTLGSRAYVAAHFGRVDAATRQVVRGPDFDALSGYFNLDWGAGRLRGIYLQGHEAVRPIFAAWLAPIADLGASTLTASGIGATDHMSFDAIGLPGFQFVRDFMEGAGGPGHTNMDVYERLVPDDLEQSAAVVAWLVYSAAMRDERLPRK